MNRVVHFEIHADDPTRAADFYRNAFGWEIKQWEGQEYWLVTTGPENQPGINGGVIKRRLAVNGTSPIIAFVCTIEVPAIDEYTAKIISFGGTVVVPKRAIPGVGWLTYFKDTEQNVFGVTQNDPGAH